MTQDHPFRDRFYNSMFLLDQRTQIRTTSRSVYTKLHNLIRQYNNKVFKNWYTMCFF